MQGGVSPTAFPRHLVGTQGRLIAINNTVISQQSDTVPTPVYDINVSPTRETEDGQDS